MEKLARGKTQDDVAAFLDRIGLCQYSDVFKNNGINGEVLLCADREFLVELNVTRSLHQMLIMELFNRELTGSTSKYSNDEYVLPFLTENHLEKYAPLFKENMVDGDMLLDVKRELMTDVLKDIGVESKVDNVKIRTMFKAYVDKM